MLATVKLRRETAVVWLLCGVTACAWVLLLREGLSPSAEFVRAHVHGVPPADRLAPFLAGWLLMLIAIMLPTTFPLQHLFSRITRDRTDHWHLTALSVVGYVAVWAVAGVVVYFGENALLKLLHPLAESQDLRWLGASVLVAAGVFEFSPLKYRCLDKCRSPLTVIQMHWTGTHPKLNAARLGIDHGLFCLGCCWALMALMIAVGAGNVAWMLALGAVMALEKNFPWGKSLAKPIGTLLVLLGIALLVR